MREVAVAGIGSVDFGALFAQKDRRNDALSLGSEALFDALDDAGLGLGDLDGLLTARLPHDRTATALGLTGLSFLNSIEGSGRMSGVAVQNAAAMIATGQADVVACVYGNDGRSAQMSYGGEAATSPTAIYAQLHGMTSVGASAAMMFQRYRHEFGAPEDALAPLAINNRANAALNPHAVMRTPISHADYLASRYVAEPLRLFDYCIINDGAVAIILTTLERARDLRKPPVRLVASAARTEACPNYLSRDFFHATSSAVAHQLYERAGVGPSDIDVLQVYDNFTPIILFSLEGFGFAPRGQGWEWASQERIALTGELPINTAGGHTGESYMQGWGHQIEAVRQVRGEAGARQVPNAKIAQYVCASPIVSAHIFMGD